MAAIKLSCFPLGYRDFESRTLKPFPFGLAISLKYVRQMKGKGVALFVPPIQIKLTVSQPKSRKLDDDFVFKKKKVGIIFAHDLRAGLELPSITVPEEADMTDNLNYCPYHRRLGHTLEICYTLKSWIQNQIHQGNIVLAQNFYKDLLRAEPCTCNMVGFGSDSDEELNFPEEEEEQEAPAKHSLMNASGMLSSGVVHQNIDVRKRQCQLGLPCLGLDSRNLLSN